MQIKIKSLTGVLYKIDCEDGDTTYTLKEKLREKLGVEPEQLQLVFGGRVMADDVSSSRVWCVHVGVVSHSTFSAEDCC
jgi:hypothetical protein